MPRVHLPDELVARLAAEAARRRISVDELAAESLTARFASAGSGAGREDALEAVIGSADSGDPGWAGRPASELRTEAYRRQAG
jgi:hypothetical protein